MGKKKKTKEFWWASACGLVDLRHAEGPYPTQGEAARACVRSQYAIDELVYQFPENRPTPWIGSTFAVHPASGFVDGPYVGWAEAERERGSNLKNYKLEVGCDEGFVGVVRWRCGALVVLERVEL